MPAEFSSELVSRRQRYPDSLGCIFDSLSLPEGFSEALLHLLRESGAARSGGVERWILGLNAARSSNLLIVQGVAMTVRNR